jgi:hypothetical protein
MASHSSEEGSSDSFALKACCVDSSSAGCGRSPACGPMASCAQRLEGGRDDIGSQGWHDFDPRSCPSGRRSVRTWDGTRTHVTELESDQSDFLRVGCKNFRGSCENQPAEPCAFHGLAKYAVSSPYKTQSGKRLHRLSFFAALRMKAPSLQATGQCLNQRLEALKLYPDAPDLSSLRDSIERACAPDRINEGPASYHLCLFTYLDKLRRSVR